MVTFMNILELNKVSYSYISKYQRVDAVKDLSLTFVSGKLYAIIGKSGSGKTTLLSMLAGLCLPDSGEIYFEGKSMKEIDRDEYRRKKAAVIYQDYNLFPRLTALENVMYTMELNGVRQKEARQKAKDLLQKMQLMDHCFNHYPKMLSGGEQQRVAIARALGIEPKILLADEPTGNLDTENSKSIINIFKMLAHENGYCVIIVTHDMSIAEEADFVYEMNDGRIKMHEATASIMHGSC